MGIFQILTIILGILVLIFGFGWYKACDKTISSEYDEVKDSIVNKVDEVKDSIVNKVDEIKDSVVKDITSAESIISKIDKIG